MPRTSVLILKKVALGYWLVIYGVNVLNKSEDACKGKGFHSLDYRL